MGVVYLARDSRLDRDVALKFLSESQGRTGAQVDAFLQEARAISRLNHPNIATIYSVDEFEGQPFLAFEYLPGGTLRSRLKSTYANGGSLPADKGFRWVVQVGRALAHAHNHGIVHRDVKSENILLTEDGSLKLTDFGVALMAGHASGGAETAGTAAYMSPEQALGLETDHLADMFSYGVVVFEMLTGRLPFDDPQEAVLLYDIAHTAAPRLAEIRDSVPSGAQELLDRLMAKDPLDRFESMDEALEAIRRLDERIRRQETRPIQPITLEPTIAVLPFVDMSSAKDEEYFCDGITEEMITALSGVKGLRVVSRTSSFQFKGQPYDIRDIGQKLDVQTVLEGSVRKAGNKLRITVQHINVGDGYHLWSQRFDREMEDIFAIQDEIANATVAHMRLELAGRRGGEKKGRQATTNLEAYNCYLQGRFHLNQRGPQSLRKALECFKTAAREDPKYALAFAGQAEAGLLLATRGHAEGDLEGTVERAREAAREAIRLDPDCAEAHVALAMVIYRVDWDFAGAEEHYRRALEINEGYATAHHQYAMLLATLSRLDEALEQIGLAQALDPLSLIISTAKGRILHFARRFGEAIEQCRRTLDLDPDFVPAYFDLCVAYGQTGQFDEARDALTRMDELEHNPLRSDTMMARYLGMIGETEKARDLLDKLIEQRIARYVTPLNLAIIYLGLGDTENAMREMEMACEQRDPSIVYVRCEPAFDALHVHPRFPALIEKIGLAAVAQL